MIKCNRCGNDKKFVEVFYGGYRQHIWAQEANGRFIYEKADYDKSNGVALRCGQCNLDVSNHYKEFLDALFEPYDEDKHGP